MTDQPQQPHGQQPHQQGYEGYDPYAGQYGTRQQYGGPQQQEWPAAQQPHQHQQPQPHPQQAYQQSYEDPLQQTQQWQGQTWETQLQAPVQTAPTPAPAPMPAPAVQPPARTAPAASTPSAPAAPSAASGESAYGPATLGGNARVTDAQRARLEGRSPIIEPGIQPAALTALLGLLLAGAATVGSYALVVPLVLLQAVTAAGWFRLNGMWPARQGIALAFLGALVADAAVLTAGRSHGPAAILGTLGVWVLLSLVLNLRSHADPDTRMYGLMAGVASAALAIVAGGYLAAVPDAVTVGAAAVAVAIVVRALPLPTVLSVVVALLAGAGAGYAVGGMTDLGGQGAVLGAAAALFACVGHRVASYDYPSRFVHFTAGVALPLTAAAPAVWILGRVLG
ncbi:hypothetical protein [Streptomyces sp. NPDC047000]|uniref:hypothetical protein n=1 Tax=Streptomyces sp. NPDC047000 TaxID=3155474 RepID=UPI0033FD8F7C